MLLQASDTSGDSEINIYLFLIGGALFVAVSLIMTALRSSSPSEDIESVDLDDHDPDLWRDLTDEHDLEFVSGAFSDDPRHLTGEYRGESVQVYERRRQELGTREDIRRHFIHYEIGLPAFVPDKMAIYDDRNVSERTTMFEDSDLPVGRTELDEAFVVRGETPETIRSFLDRDEVAAPLVALADARDAFEIEEGVLTVTEKSSLLDDGALDDLVDTVERLREAGPSSEPDSDGYVTDLSET